MRPLSLSLIPRSSVPVIPRLNVSRASHGRAILGQVLVPALYSCLSAISQKLLASPSRAHVSLGDATKAQEEIFAGEDNRKTQKKGQISADFLQNNCEK